MGVFRDSAEEGELREAINNIATLAGGVVSGQFLMEDLREVLDGQMEELRAMYDAVAVRNGPKAPKKLLKESVNIAIIWCGDAPGSAMATRRLMGDVLASVNRPL